MSSFTQIRNVEQEVSERCNVLGVAVSAINMQSAVQLADEFLRQGGKGYVCVTGVHGVTEAQDDQDFRRILNRSFLTTPDGMPMVWVGRLQGHADMDRVYGPDFMTEVCRLSLERGYRHFFYGGREGVADALKDALVSKFPGLQVVGTYTPPFRPLNEAEELHLREMIERVKPHVLWVGLSTPKQERFMARYIDMLNVGLMVGVGAAFDLHTGNMKDAPGWMKRAGLQWLHRLVQEPGRLWKRYLINNPLFLFRMCLQMTGLRRYRIEP